jgi:phospholipid transport system substrate-binding protein
MQRLLILLVSLGAAMPAIAAPQTTAPAAPAAPAAPVGKAPAKAGPGTAAVKSANEKISGYLRQQEKPAAGSAEEKALAAKVTASVRDFLDIDELGKRAMSDQWSKLTKEQQTEFLTTLRSLIEDNYVKGLRSNLAYTVDYTGETTDKDGNVIVNTVINTKRKGRPFKISIDYVLKNEGGKLKAWDVKTDGVGLVENYRVQFNKIIEKDGFAGLISKMKKKQNAG